MRRRDTGYTLIELLVALALSAIIAAVVGSLFVGSLSAWRRGRDVREVQIQAVGLVDLMARDVRNSIRAPGVISRPGHSEGDGEPILLLSAKAQSTPGPGQQWILYTFASDRGEVLRQILTALPGERSTPQGSAVVGRGIVRIAAEAAGDGVTIEVEARRGKATAQARATASPRNP